MDAQLSMRNRDLPKGVVRTRAGHLRYTSPKELRHKYVHRKVIEDLMEQMPVTLRMLLPWPYEVHHMDYNKENNSPENLLIVSEAFHSVMTADERARHSNGKFKPKWTKPPDWLPLLDSVLDMPDEVPF